MVRRHTMYSRIPRFRRAPYSCVPRVEHKFLDGTSGPITALVAGAFMHTTLNFVAQGTTQSQRVGRKITVKSLEVRGDIKLPDTGSLLFMDNRVRLIFFIDKQTNGAAATLDEIINLSGTVTINSFRDLANQQRFRIIYDQWFDLPVRAVLQDSAATGDSVPIELGFKFKKALNLPIMFDDGVSTGAISSQRSNNIGSFCIASQSVIAPIVSYTFRIRFTDA